MIPLPRLIRDLDTMIGDITIRHCDRLVCYEC